MAEERVEDPYGSFHFKLELGKDEVVNLIEVSGLKTATSAYEIKEGGQNAYAHKRPDRSTWEPLVIRYASSTNRALEQWRTQFVANPFDENLIKNGAIILVDNHGDVLRRYAFVRAWPVSWEGPTFDAGQSDLALETLEIAHEGIEVSDP